MSTTGPQVPPPSSRRKAVSPDAKLPDPKVPDAKVPDAKRIRRTLGKTRVTRPRLRFGPRLSDYPVEILIAVLLLLLLVIVLQP